MDHAEERAKAVKVGRSVTMFTFILVHKVCITYSSLHFTWVQGYCSLPVYVFSDFDVAGTTM